MKVQNGNIPKALVLGHNNMGAGKIDSKLNDVLNILCFKCPDILGISETVMTDEAIDMLTNENLTVEIKEDCDRRISVVIKDSIIYT